MMAFTIEDIQNRYERYLEMCDLKGTEPMDFEEFASDFYDLWEE